MSRQHYHVEGRAVPPGALVRTTRGWVTPTPVHCPNGHSLKEVGMLVGFVPCRTSGRNGHQTHCCRRCKATLYTPPLEDNCACRVITGR